MYSDTISKIERKKEFEWIVIESGFFFVQTIEFQIDYLFRNKT